jgi:hypothetical protein
MNKVLRDEREMAATCCRLLLVRRKLDESERFPAAG